MTTLFGLLPFCPGTGVGEHTTCLWSGYGAGHPEQVAIGPAPESSLPRTGFGPREGFGLGAQRPGAHQWFGAKRRWCLSQGESRCISFSLAPFSASGCPRHHEGKLRFALGPVGVGH